MTISSISPRTSPASAPLLPVRSTSPSFREVLRSDGLTPMTGQEASACIRDAWTAVTGEAPAPGTLAILWAQWAHETARGTRMYGHNFGGIKGTGPTGMSLRLRTREGHGTSERSIRDTFRAYPDASTGARDWLELLVRRYPEAMRSAGQGDASGFVRGLRSRGYFTGSADEYHGAIRALAREALEGPRPAQAPPPVHLGLHEQGVVDAFRRASERRHEGDEG